jgi:hypothetical protein
MISLATKRKKQLFKESNVSLYRLLFVIVCLITPILLIFAPLPGYLLNESEYLSVKLFAVSFFIFLSFTESFLYWRFWSRKELLYLIYLQGKNSTLVKYAMHFTFTRTFFFIFVFSAFFKVQVSIASLLYVFACYSLLLLTFIIFYEFKIRTVQQQIKSFNLLLLIKLAGLSFTNGVKTRGVFVVAILSLSFLFQHRLIEFDVLSYYLITFFFLISFLFYSISKVVNMNIEQNHVFMKSISYSFYFHYKMFIKLTMFLLFLLSILLNFQILIRNIIL